MLYNSLRLHLYLLQTIFLRVINVSVVSLSSLLKVQFLAGFLPLSHFLLVCELRCGKLLVCLDSANEELPVSAVRRSCCCLLL